MSIHATRAAVLGCAALLSVTTGAMSSPAFAQGRSDPDQTATDYGRDPVDRYRDETGIVSLRTGLGFTADPDTFLLGFEGDYVFSDPFSTGVLVQLGVDDDLTMVSPVAYLRYRLDLGQLSPSLERVEPYLQGGLGLTYWDVDHMGHFRNKDDTEFLMNFGFGVEYRLTNHISAGSHMLFNVIPNEIFDERFYFSWEVATLRYRF